MPRTIEELWSTLRREASSAQRRIDASHPLDLYADFDHPDRPGLVLFSPSRPPEAPSLKAIDIQRRQRHDSSWSMRIVLEEPRLLPVFAELCRDIVEFTRSGVDPVRPGGPVLSRIDRWRTLMQADAAALTCSRLRGLIGELLVLETRVLPSLGPDDAVLAWTGPLGTDQDFLLPDGARIEVKALDRDAGQVRINGLGQLDAGEDPLELAAVRLEDCGREAEDAITASRLVTRLSARLSDAPVALRAFEGLLRFAGWDASADTDSVVVRLHRIDYHAVNDAFPRLTVSLVPQGVLDASYEIALPQIGAS